MDLEIGRAQEEVDKQVVGAEGRRAQAENRHSEVMNRRERRRTELVQQRSLTLQGVEKTGQYRGTCPIPGATTLR